jgi:hypothetical protein
MKIGRHHQVRIFSDGKREERRKRVLLMEAKELRLEQFPTWEFP